MENFVKQKTTNDKDENENVFERSEYANEMFRSGKNATKYAINFINRIEIVLQSTLTRKIDKFEMSKEPRTSNLK